MQRAHNDGVSTQMSVRQTHPTPAARENNGEVPKRTSPGRIPPARLPRASARRRSRQTKERPARPARPPGAHGRAGPTTPGNRRHPAAAKPVVHPGGHDRGVIGLAAWSMYYMAKSGPLQSTDDAYIEGKIVRISPKVSGQVQSCWSTTTRR